MTQLRGVTTTSTNSRLPGRPQGAKGAYLRLISITDTYTLHNFPHVVQAVREAREVAARDPEGCVLATTHSGDIVSPTPLTSLDFGKSMIEGLNRVQIDYACLGNHEFDLTIGVLQKRIHEFQGTWLNSNITDPCFTGANGKTLPTYDIINVGRRKVAIGGFCTTQSDIYPPGTLRSVVPVNQSVFQTWEQATLEDAEAMVPLTHQSIDEDRALIAALHKDPRTRGRMPIILGGHEHEVYEVAEEGGTILKVGQDAETLGVVDLWWDAAGCLCSGYQLIEASAFAREPTCDAFVARKEETLGSMRGVTITHLGEPMSSRGTRQKPEKIARLMCTKIKHSVPGADICILQGGCVRGKADYAPGSFTYGDLMNELPFETEICVVRLPGSVIAQSVANSRSRPDTEVPTFLHVDEDAEFEAFPSLACRSINGQPFDPEALYTVAIYRVLVAGMNEVQPLLSHVQTSGMRVPDLEEALPAKQLVMETCMKEEWWRLLGLPPSAKACSYGHAHLEEAVMRSFAEMDINGDGHVDLGDLTAYLATAPTHYTDSGQVCEQLLSWLISTLDQDQNGCLSLEDLRSIIVH